MLGQPVAQHAGDDVVGAAGRKAHDELDRAIGVLVLRERRRERNDGEAKQGDAESNDAHGIPPIDLHVWPWRIGFALWSDKSFRFRCRVRCLWVPLRQRFPRFLPDPLWENGSADATGPVYAQAT